MSIRETLDKNKPLTTAAAIVLIAVCAVVMWRNSQSALPANLQRAYFSNDDGKTFFPEDIRKVPPFEHQGKPAYRAYVFKCDKGEPFVAYLERYKESARSKAAEVLARPPNQQGQDLADLSTATEIRRPGDDAWVSPQSAAGNEVMTIRCPNGGKNPQGVYPD